MTTSPLSPTARTTLGRSRERGVRERERLHDFLAEALIGHLGVVVDGDPLVLPVAFAVDPAGPDQDGTLYVHGSVAAGWMRAAAGATVCVTVTEVDGLVTARSAFHHSMNYRSAVVIGRARVVDDEAERQRALELTVDHVVPGRATTLRPSTRKELAATAMLAVPLHEASLKQRAGGPVDDQEDVAAGSWAGHVPLRRVTSGIVDSPDSSGRPPPDVVRRAGWFS